MTSELRKRLHSIFADKDNSGPVAMEKIEHAERLLGVVFPASYRAFLETYGASLHVAPYEIAGLPPAGDPPYWSSVVADTQQMREGAGGESDDYIAISGNGDDYIFLLAASRDGSSVEPPVLAIGPGLEYVQVASSFVEFAERASSGDPLSAWRT